MADDLRSKIVKDIEELEQILADAKKDGHDTSDIDRKVVEYRGLLRLTDAVRDFGRATKTKVS